MAQGNVYYGDYLQLDKILDAQSLESAKDGNSPAHEEMLFIVIHQAYELWFKQIMHEVNSVIQIMGQPSINDNSPELQKVVLRLKRCVTIMNVLVHQIDILETMTPMQFLEFRDLLRPASGFQSWQFKILEAKLGLKWEDRHGQEYYISQLRQKEIDLIKNAEDGRSFIELVNAWLERMPFADNISYWQNTDHPEGFWKLYESVYASTLADAEKNNLEFFNKILLNDDASRSFSAKANRAALFITLYRGYPMLELPFQLLDVMLEIDHQLGLWRFRHINMVKRMIGSRIGTGGSTGAGYLQGALDKHFIFRELAQLNSFIIDMKKLPKLPQELERKLGF